MGATPQLYRSLHTCIAHAGMLHVMIHMHICSNKVIVTMKPASFMSHDLKYIPKYSVYSVTAIPANACIWL